MDTPGLTFQDYVADLNRRRAAGLKTMILYADWLQEQLAVRAAQARLETNGRPRPMGKLPNMSEEDKRKILALFGGPRVY